MLSSGLNSLASASGALQSVGTNAAVDNTNGYDTADFELSVTFGSAPTAGTTIDVYGATLSSDGATYTDGAGGSSPVNPLGSYICSFTLRAVTTKQIIPLYDVPIPGEVLILNVLNNSGVAFPSSGSTIRIRRQGEQYS
jgi:hypothetical protein